MVRSHGLCTFFSLSDPHSSSFSLWYFSIPFILRFFFSFFFDYNFFFFQSSTISSDHYFSAPFRKIITTAQQKIKHVIRFFFFFWLINDRIIVLILINSVYLIAAYRYIIYCLNFVKLSTLFSFLFPF